MQSTHTFVVEIGCEELPPKSLYTLARAFHDAFCASLKQADLTFARSAFFCNTASIGA